jgi:hypothetical protein
VPTIRTCAATIFVKELEPMASFYAVCFGLDEVVDAPSKGSTLIKLSFDAMSIAAVRATIAGLDGRVDEVEWEFRGYPHCDFVDLEGNVGQPREPATSSA